MTATTLVSLDDFVARHRGLPAGTFFDEVVDPYLLTADTATTVDDDASSAGITACIPRFAPGPRAPATLMLPVRNRPGADPMPGMITLGRAPTCDLVLPHPRLSRFQAFFRRLHGRWHVDDACSTNGTSVDGRPVVHGRSAPLAAGARLVFAAAVEVVFLDPPALRELVLELGRRQDTA
mgnify:CR=1 FL=1